MTKARRYLVTVYDSKGHKHKDAYIYDISVVDLYGHMFSLNKRLKENGFVIKRTVIDAVLALNEPWELIETNRVGSLEVEGKSFMIEEKSHV